MEKQAYAFSECTYYCHGMTSFIMWHLQENRHNLLAIPLYGSLLHPGELFGGFFTHWPGILVEA